MKLFVSIIIAILPIYLICLYIYKNDKHKETIHILLKLFIFGFFSCIPAAYLEYNLESLFESIKNINLIVLFLYVSIGIALVEELFKWLILYGISYNNKEFDELYDMIVYAVFVSLGFATFENIIYVLNGGVSVGLIRSVTAIPSHAADAIVMGSYLGLAKLNDVNNNKKTMKTNLILSIILPVIIHSIYDYLLLTKLTLCMILFSIFTLILYIYVIKKIKYISNNSIRILKK